MVRGVIEPRRHEGHEGGLSSEVERAATAIVESAVEVHRTLGPGLLESAYQRCLEYELRSAGLKVACEVPLPIQYKKIKLDGGYRLDMLVEEAVIIENKTVDELLPIHTAQLITYLKLSGHRLGFLLNWNVSLMKHGIKRLVL